MYDAPSEPSDNDNVIPTTTSSYIQLVCYPRSGKTAIQVFHNTGAIDSEDSEMCGSEAIHLAGHAAHSDRSIYPYPRNVRNCLVHHAIALGLHHRLASLTGSRIEAIKLIAYTEHVGWRSRAMTSGSSSFSWRLSALTAIEMRKPRVSISVSPRCGHLSGTYTGS